MPFNVTINITPVNDCPVAVDDNYTLAEGGILSKVVGDGVAYMAHDLADLKKIDLDFYGFSLYKTFGPHLALLYVKKELLEDTKNLTHEFLSKEIPLTKTNHVLF